MSTPGINFEQLENIIKNLPGMAYQGSINDNRPMTFVSDGCVELTGFSKIQFESQSLVFDDLIHNDDYQFVHTSIQQAILKHKPFDIEYRILTHDRIERWVRDRGKASVQHIPSDILSIEGFIIDITLRKLADIEVSHDHAFLTAVLNTVEEGIVTFDGNGDIGTVNLSMQRLFGCDALQLLGHNIDTIIPSLNLTEAGVNSNEFENLIMHKSFSLSRNCNARRNDNSEFPVFLWVSVIKEHTPKKFVGLIRDRSFRVEVEKDNRKHTEQLAHIDRLNMLGEMAAGIAHEINQPLTAISLFAQAGKRLLQTKKYEQLFPVFEKLSGHALRAGDVIERMQSMAKPGDHHKEIINCVEMVRETVKLAQNEANFLDIEIKIIEEKELPLVKIDKIQIQQVVLNLLRNAVQSISAQQSEQNSTINLTLKRNESNGLTIFIVDSGTGVSNEMKDKLFLPFSTSRHQGMGMGLSICQAIVIEHGGQLNFYNNASEGATFFFSLPNLKSGAL